MALRIIDDAVQAHGGAGVSQDFGLAKSWAGIRTLRLADGPDEVHNRAIALMEFVQGARSRSRPAERRRKQRNEPVRPHRQSRDHHRLLARHRPGDRRAMADQGARSSSPAARRRPAPKPPTRSNAKHGEGTAIVVPANISSKEALQNLVDETRASSAGSTSSSATPPPILITGRWRGSATISSARSSKTTSSPITG
jgi:hypothetical protein